LLDSLLQECKMAEKLCYNRGCGKTFTIRDTDEVCVYHPGSPFFHDAYKGWSCCQNKSTDFTTFLNMPGCTKGKHSNVKPVEPENITGNLNKDSSPEIVEVRAPIAEALPRPPITTPLVRLKTTVAASLKDQIKSLNNNAQNEDNSSEVKIGEPCKNNGCKSKYCGPEQDYSNCKHHPGVPVFHEGMKYWSCCQRKTTEFQQFLDQEGCEIGNCVWIRQDGQDGVVNCRYDWHQTATHVTVAIYAKKYDPNQSFVEINPIRLKAHLYFPQEKGSFDVDIELRGIAQVDASSCSMFGTKTEIKLKKAESGSWARLDVVKPPPAPAKITQQEDNITDTESKVNALELDDLDFTPQRFTLSQDAMTKKYS